MRNPKIRLIVMIVVFNMIHQNMDLSILTSI